MSPNLVAKNFPEPIFGFQAIETLFQNLEEFSGIGDVLRSHPLQRTRSPATEIVTATIRKAAVPSVTIGSSNMRTQDTEITVIRSVRIVMAPITVVCTTEKTRLAMLVTIPLSCARRSPRSRIRDKAQKPARP